MRGVRTVLVALALTLVALPAPRERARSAQMPFPRCSVLLPRPCSGELLDARGLPRTPLDPARSPARAHQARSERFPALRAARIRQDRTPEPSEDAFTPHGNASWYGERPIACWDRRSVQGFDRRTSVPRSLRLWTAHRTLPCGTIVLVTYRGRSVRVPVMDRGPYSGDRVLDLSRDAFAALAPLSRGVIAVRFTVLR